MSKLCVVGGGLSGLEFALHAAIKGKRVHIYEAGPSLRKKHVNFDTRKLAGDEKKRHWTSDENWGLGGGISERLGGRSLCYHGVMIPIEDEALSSWPVAWRRILTGEKGLYRQVSNLLSQSYPEMSRKQKEGTQLSHTPQAAKLTDDGKFFAYSPLYSLESFLNDGVITIERANIAKISQSTDGFYLTDNQGKTVNRSGFSKCVLATSAIVNNAIIANSIEKSFSSKITDHYCLGIFVKVDGGKPVGEFRHQMIWTGYSEHHDLSSNIFVLERPRAEDGDRILEFMAVMEQSPLHSDLSQLNCHYSGGKASLKIDSHHSKSDIDIFNKIAKRLVAFASEVLGVELKPLTGSVEVESSGKFFKSSGKDIRWDEYNHSLDTLNTTEQSNVYSRFSLPYGSFEHESCCHAIGSEGPSALTEELELTTMPGVYAIGPGAFPRLGIANPALTICAVSRWLASNI
ncbi:NAD-binding protein [Aliikangiella coralliicola]|uniref:Uncharacterized protein n=1 Tax=Aliikangiella coralliicola TaxID=2592383 RepID=A0A545U0E8_9GAMM|nr:NAD-binding protein [Aliikangiella coralliicola]TQV82935.1 hypothetical protein FLL46_24505 [Aliikangiella coralliicola]